MNITYPCGCKAVVYASSSSMNNRIGRIEPIPFLHLCQEHMLRFDNWVNIDEKAAGCNS